jgi:predicted enzyme related to lactoylglutathione lyase
MTQTSGRIVKDKMSIGQHGHIALVTDLDGNIIGFHSMS